MSAIGTHRLTQRMAYILWEAAGGPDNMADHFWYEAEKYVKANVADVDDSGMHVLDVGYFFCPNVPVVVHQPKVELDPESFNPRRGIVTRYGKKLLREGAKYYQKLTIGQAVLGENGKTGG